MNIGFQNQLTYYGTLDDVVDRYPWPRGIDLDTARRQLITSAIYRKTALINDGYLVTNRHLVGDLEDLNRSLLGNMLSSGSARLFTRSGDTNLAAGLERTAQNVESHKELIQRPEWTDIADNLSFLERDAGRGNIRWPAHKNMGEMFHLLLKDTADTIDGHSNTLISEDERPDFLSVFREYERNISSSFDGARTVWEISCWRALANREVDPWDLMGPDGPEKKAQKFEGYERVRPMMNVANEVYHLAYAAGAHASLRDGQHPDVQDMIVGTATAYLDESYNFAPIEEAGGTEQSTFVLEHIDRLLITVPANISFGGDYSFVRDMTLHAPTRRVGNEYLAALSKFMSDGSGVQDVSNLRAEYANALARIMQPHVNQGPASKVVDALLTTGFSLPIEAVEFGVNAVKWCLSIGADQMNSRMVERVRRAYVSAQLQEQANFATQFPTQGRFSREIGFYLGPLQPDAMESLAERASPHPAVAQSDCIEQ